MRQLAGCDNGWCPKIFEPQDGTTDVLVQGYVTDHATLTAHGGLAIGESVVRIPREVLLEAARALEA